MLASGVTFLDKSQGIHVAFLCVSLRSPDRVNGILSALSRNVLTSDLLSVLSWMMRVKIEIFISVRWLSVHVDLYVSVCSNCSSVWKGETVVAFNLPPKLFQLDRTDPFTLNKIFGNFVKWIAPI